MARHAKTSRPAARSRSSKELLAVDAANQIRELMHRGVLRPGMHINQLDLASQLGISRTPVRDALIQLEREGFVSRSGQRGLSVAAVDLDDLLSLYEVREFLEACAARLTAERATPRTIQDLLERHEAMAIAANEYDPFNWTRLNIDFHIALFEASGNPKLADQKPIIYLTLQHLYPTISWRRQQPVQSWAEHEAILEAIQAHDAERAETLARAHIADAIRLIHESVGRESGSPH